MVTSFVFDSEFRYKNKKKLTKIVKNEEKKTSERLKEFQCYFKEKCN